ncbi:MAG: hypothetical protein U0V72_01770 [Cytophagales bacterium]
MKIDKDLNSKIDLFLNNQLDPAEKLDFEKEISQNPELSQEIHFHKNIHEIVLEAKLNDVRNIVKNQIQDSKNSNYKNYLYGISGIVGLIGIVSTVIYTSKHSSNQILESKIKTEKTNSDSNQTTTNTISKSDIQHTDSLKNTLLNKVTYNHLSNTTNLNYLDSLAQIKYLEKLNEYKQIDTLKNVSIKQIENSAKEIYKHTNTENITQNNYEKNDTTSKQKHRLLFDFATDANLTNEIKIPTDFENGMFKIFSNAGIVILEKTWDNYSPIWNLNESRISISQTEEFTIVLYKSNNEYLGAGKITIIK